jgi:hypothetical protein
MPTKAERQFIAATPDIYRRAQAEVRANSYTGFPSDELQTSSLAMH